MRKLTCYVACQHLLLAAAINALITLDPALFLDVNFSTMSHRQEEEA